MFIEELKMLGGFLRMTIPRFSKVASENSFVFLTAFKDRLHNFFLVETRDIYYTRFLLDLVARHWWRCYLSPGQQDLLYLHELSSLRFSWRSLCLITLEGI